MYKKRQVPLRGPVLLISRKMSRSVLVVVDQQITIEHHSVSLLSDRKAHVHFVVVSVPSDSMIESSNQGPSETHVDAFEVIAFGGPGKNAFVFSNYATIPCDFSDCLR